MMKNIFIMLAVMTAILFSGCDSAKNKIDKNLLEIENLTGTDIYGVWIRRLGSANWGNNILPNRIQNNATIELNAVKHKNFELMLRTATTQTGGLGFTIPFPDFQIGTKIIILPDNCDVPFFFIQNEENINIQGVWVRESDKDDWGNNRLLFSKEDEAYTGATFPTDGVYDIMLRTSTHTTGGIGYLINSKEITNGLIINFKGTDRIPYVSFQNKTGYAINSIHFRETDSFDWGVNRLSIPILADNGVWEVDYIKFGNYDIKFLSPPVDRDTFSVRVPFIKLNQDVSEGKIISLDTTEKSAYDYGNTGPAGGIVFYDKGNNTDGWQYLEIALDDIENPVQWGVYAVEISGTQTGIGTGNTNTQIIINRLETLGETNRAAQLCDDFVFGELSDWFLPSKDELYLVYQNLPANSLTQLSGWYWTSSQYDVRLFTYLQNLNNGTQHNYPRFFMSKVRAIRAF